MWSHLILSTPERYFFSLSVFLILQRIIHSAQMADAQVQQGIDLTMASSMMT